MFSPAAIKISLITVVSLIGAIVIVTRKARALVGYREIAGDVRKIAADFRAQISRDGDELRVSGTRSSGPAILSFSHSGNAWLFSVRSYGPVNFRLLLVPKTKQVSPEGVSIRTNTRLDNSFVCYTADAVEAQIFLGLPAVGPQLEKLCSLSTDLRFSEGKIEFSELLQASNLAERVRGRLEAIDALALESAAMPNAGRVKIQPIPHQKQSWAFRAAVIAGLITGVSLIFSRGAKVEGSAAVTSHFVDGVAAGDLKIIPGVQDWRLIRDEELDVSFITWLDPGATADHVKFSLDAAGKNELNAPAYFLTTDKAKDSKRIVWIVDGRVIYDNVGPAIGIARVPRESIDRVNWAENGIPQETPDGEGLLVVREYDSPAGATIFFVHSGSLYSGIPVDYRSLAVK